MSEYLLESGKGGSIANVAYSPCGVSSTSQLLYKEFLDNLFKRGENCLGRAVFAAKCSIIARNPEDDSVYGPAVLWTLLGDPALRVKHRISSAVEEPDPRLGVRTSQFGVSISPNPCDASTTIRLAGSSSIVGLSAPCPTVHRSSLSIYDASGRLVLSHPVQTSSFPLGTSSFPSGVYVVRCTSGADCTSARLLVRHR
jgi:hypothetical protein